MERFGPGGNLPVKVFHQRWSSLTSRPGPTENCSSFSETFVSSPASARHTTVKMADSSDVSVYECSLCKLQTQDVNFLLMHSWTQAQVQQSILICFFFWFSPVFKDKYIAVDYWLLSEC